MVFFFFCFLTESHSELGNLSGRELMVGSGRGMHTPLHLGVHQCEGEGTCLFSLVLPFLGENIFLEKVCHGKSLVAINCHSTPKIVQNTLFFFFYRLPFHPTPFLCCPNKSSCIHPSMIYDYFSQYILC